MAASPEGLDRFRNVTVPSGAIRMETSVMIFSPEGMGGFFHFACTVCLIRARYQEKSSAMPSGRPSIPAPSPPEPGASPGTAAESRDLISAALGAGGPWGAALASPLALVTFFFTPLTFTSCFLGVGDGGLGIAGGVSVLGSSFLGVGLGSGFGGTGVSTTGSGTGSGAAWGSG